MGTRSFPVRISEYLITTTGRISNDKIKFWNYQTSFIGKRKFKDSPGNEGYHGGTQILWTTFANYTYLKF